MKSIALALIRFYQRFLSPAKNALTGGGGACRFHPTCSEYTRQAIVRFGLCKGTYLGLRRLLRCHPWGGFGEDPVPPAPKDRPDSK